jgi:hypothetical protein
MGTKPSLPPMTLNGTGWEPDKKSASWAMVVNSAIFMMVFIPPS